MFDAMLDVFFPRSCFGCGKWRQYVCKECYASLQKDVWPEEYAGSSIAKDSAVKISRIKEYRGMFIYAENFQKLLCGAKYRPAEKAMYELIGRIRKRQREAVVRLFTQWQIDYIVPVPMHPKKLQRRGFNQAEIFAEWLGYTTSTNVLLDLVEKSKLTHPQASQTKQGRKNNIREAFVMDNDIAMVIKNKRVVIVDDVITTGATLNEIATTLQAAQPKDVYGFALARNLMS